MILLLSPVGFSLLTGLSFHLVQFHHQHALVIELMDMGRSEIKQRLVWPGLIVRTRCIGPVPRAPIVHRDNFPPDRSLPVSPSHRTVQSAHCRWAVSPGQTITRPPGSRKTPE